MVSEKLGAAFIEVGVDTGGLTTGLAGAKAQVEGFGASASSAFSGLAASINPATIAIAGATAGIVALGAAITSSISTAANFQQSMANVASVTGGGAEALEALSNAAREAGASTVFSATEAADAQYYLASAGMNTEQIVASLNDTLLLAGAGSLEMGRAAEIVTNSLSQFSMEASESGRVANVLAAAASGSNTTVSQMGIAMNKVGPIANALGMSYEQTAASLMVLANAGIKGEEGGTMLRGVLASLMDISPKAAEALEEMGLSAEDVDPALHSFDDIMVTLQEHGMTATQAVQLFGREAASAGVNLVKGAGDVDTFTEAITGTSKAQEMYNTQTDTFNGAMKMLGSAVEEAKISLGNVFLPVLTDAVKWLTEGVTAATNFGKSIYEMYGKVAAAEEKLGAFGVGEMVGYALNPTDALGGAFGWAKGKLGFETGKEIGEDLAEGVAEGTEGVGPAIEENLENVDAEGVGEDLGHAAGTGYRNAWNEEMQRRADFHEPSSSKFSRSGFLDVEGEELQAKKTADRNYNWQLFLNGKQIAISQTYGNLWDAFVKESPALAALTDPREFQAMIEEARGNEAQAAEIRAEIKLDADLKAEAERLQAEFETAFSEALEKPFAVGGLGATMADLLEDVAEDGWAAFEDGLITASEASDIETQLADLKLADPEAFEEAGGQAALSWWGRLVGMLEQRSYNIANNIDCTGIDETIQKHIDAGEPYIAEVTANVTISPEASALREALFWEGYDGSETKAGLGEFADDLYALGETADELGGDFADAYAIITNPWQYEAGTVALASDYIKSLLPDNVDPDAVDAIAAYFVRTTEAGMEKANTKISNEVSKAGMPDWMSHFSYFQEDPTNNMFYKSYIGETVGWAGPGLGSKPGYESSNYFQYGVEVDLTLDPTEANSKLETLEGDITTEKIAPVEADIAPALSELERLEAEIMEPVTKPIYLQQMNDLSGDFSVQAQAPGSDQWLSFAEGGIISSPTVAIVGDARTPEVAAPLGDLLPMIQQAVATAGGGSVTVNAPITVYGGGDAREIAREVAEELKIEISDAYVGRLRGGH